MRTTVRLLNHVHYRADFSSGCSAPWELRKAFRTISSPGGTVPHAGRPQSLGVQRMVILQDVPIQRAFSAGRGHLQGEAWDAVCMSPQRRPPNCLGDRALASRCVHAREDGGPADRSRLGSSVAANDKAQNEASPPQSSLQ